MLQGKRVVLRPVRQEDADELAVLANDAEIAARTLQIPHPYGIEDAHRFLLSATLQMERGVAHIFAITRGANSRPIGVIGLGEFQKLERRAEVGFWVGRPYWNQGFVTEALHLVVGFAFAGLKLHRVVGEVFAWNAASCRVFEKCGFRHEGTLRDHRYKQGAWITCEIYGRLESD